VNRQGCSGYGDSHGYGYEDGDETPWACWDSAEIFENGYEIKRKRVKHAKCRSRCLKCIRNGTFVS